MPEQQSNDGKFRPLRRPNRTRPLTQAELLKMVGDFPPPAWWFTEGEQSPFKPEPK